MVAVTNTGARGGKAVVQVYVESPTKDERRPLRQLGGFGVIRLDPGEKGEVTVTVPARSFARWDETTAQWVQDPGCYRLHVGTSSRHLDHVVEVDRRPKP